LAVEDFPTSKMDVLETLKTYIVAEAKSVGSDEISQTHVFIGVANLLLKWDVITKTDPMYLTAQKLHQSEMSRDLEGYNTPEFSAPILKLINKIETVEALLDLGEYLLNESIELSSRKSTRKITDNMNKKIVAIGGFHEVQGSRIGRLPKYMPNKDDAALLIQGFLQAGEVYVWDGVYNTKDNQLSTRRGTQSMGRVFVTNQRLIFWSDDEDKPHIGILYADIESWKTSWMPLKSRGVVMYVGGRKVIFAANSTTMEHATRYIGATK
jgi:hypothetical protein